MSIITGAVETRRVHAEAAENGVCLGAFCFDDQCTIEAILEGARRKGGEMGVPDVPIVASTTANYPPRGQARQLGRPAINILEVKRSRGN